MCGIAGNLFFDESRHVEESVIKTMCDAIVHRGPDSYGCHVHGNVGMGMRRLAIIDIEGGDQPIFNEDKSVSTVFNGEIYNFRELRAQLTAKGHVFSTRSDTEVIVHAYEEYGTDFPKHLNGMFAISLYDRKIRRLMLVRDHIGIKPLYYIQTGDGIAWASEIKALLAGGQNPGALDPDALACFLSWEYVAGERTLFDSVKRLMPATSCIIDAEKKKVRLESYWDVPVAEEDQCSEEEWLERLADCFAVAVNRQMVSDVPLGAFLSGGVDSSLMVAKMGEATTFSIGFEDPAYNELDWSKRVAEHLGVEHVTEILNPDVDELFRNVMEFMDDPIGDYSVLPVFLVSRLARKRVTVSLGGDGGDELFGGYETHLAQELTRKAAPLPVSLLAKVMHGFTGLAGGSSAKGTLHSRLKRYAGGFQFDKETGHARWRRFLSMRGLSKILLPEVFSRVVNDPGDHIRKLYECSGNRDPVNRMLYVDLKSYLSDNLLTKLDRMSMAVSLEARVPYLDREMVEMAFRVPGAFKIKGLCTKAILKKLAARHVPDDCVYRPKRGFTVPVRDWLRDSLDPLLREYLSAESLDESGVFNQKSVAQLLKEHHKRCVDHSHILWNILVFQYWKKRWLDKS